MTLRQDLASMYLLGFRHAVSGAACAQWHKGTKAKALPTMYEHGYQRGLRSLKAAERDALQVATGVMHDDA